MASLAVRPTGLLTVLCLLLAVLVLPAPPASAGPVKCTPEDTTPDDRVFPEPRNSQTFLRFDEFECGIALLAETYPDLLEVTVVGESFDGHPIYDVVMTDETAPPPDGQDEKEKLLVVSSIHGGEVGGREGAVRNIEDMLDPRFLADEVWVQQVLDEFAIHWLFPNPDGWVLGDIIGTQGASFVTTRGNGNGTDLNRQFPVSGYIANATLSEPESVAIDEALLQGDGWYLGTDNHGQGPDTYAAAGLQIVGEFDFQKSETLARFADGITENMANYDGLSSLAALNEATGQDIGPYHWGTLYDMLGYSASGSLIDYYNTVDGTAGTGFATELTVGTEVNMALHSPQLNQLYVDSIRAINYTMFQQAIDRQTHTYPVGGRAGYLFDPAIVTDEDGAGYEPDVEAGELDTVEPYAVTRMQFFDDLNRYADRPLDEVTMAEVLDGTVDLDSFDSFVIADSWMPEEADAAAWTESLRGYVENGGNLIVTDAAAPLVAELGLVSADDISLDPHYVGSVEEFTDRDHPLNADLRGVASQTFDTVPIGLAFPPAGEHAPNWTLTQSAWDADGGFTAGTNGTGRTIYGEKPLGEGVVRFLGALLPQPTEDFYHPYGLQNYAVTYTGYTLLANMLVWENPNRQAAEVDVRRVAGPTRVDTAIAFSQEAFDTADRALLARADKSPDALAASTLAGALDAPVLLTETDALAPQVGAELARLGAETVTLLGGETAISTEVEEALRAEGYSVERVAGATRFETAGAVADAVAVSEGGAPSSALVAVGERPHDEDPGPDAITAGVLGVATGQPVLLTRPDDLPPETAAAIQGSESLERVTIVGGADAVSEAVADQLRDLGLQVDRIDGSDRYATAAAVADAAVEAGAGTAVVGLSGGDATADALVAGPALHHLGGTSLLVDGASLDASPATSAWLTGNAGMLHTVLVAGGPARVDDAVLRQLSERLG